MSTEIAFNTLEKELNELEVLTHQITQIARVPQDATDFPVWPGHNKGRSTKAMQNGKSRAF